MRTLILFAGILSMTTSVYGQMLDNVRELSELNDPITTDAYPTISNDGLRIYFTSSDGAGNNVFFSSRPDLDTDFEPRELVDSALFSGLVSSWFSPDELEVYFTTYTELFHASRPSTTSSFGAATEITLAGLTSTFFSGPSLTPGGEELYLYSTNNTTDGLMEFEYTNDTTYTLVSEVLPPAGYEGGIAQLSKDGLQLYWSLQPSGTDSYSLFVSDRSALGTSFSTPVAMNSLINDSNPHNAQPSYATAANALVWVRNDQPLWKENQLYIAQSSQASLVELNSEEKELVKIVDLLGRETNFVPGVVLIFVYSDGSTEKRFNMK